MLPCRTGRAETENPLPPGRRQCIFRIFDVVCECLIDYEQIMKDSHEIS